MSKVGVISFLNGYADYWEKKLLRFRNNKKKNLIIFNGFFYYCCIENVIYVTYTNPMKHYKNYKIKLNY